ncbi:MAG: hypothetical protein WCK02_13420 [Bacteroidota bacterium]
MKKQMLTLEEFKAKNQESCLGDLSINEVLAIGGEKQKPKSEEVATITYSGNCSQADVRKDGTTSSVGDWYCE